MLVTIIVACYNAEKYIKDTLDSCINQTYTNLQIIITDDCSQDTSIEIINEWLNEKKITHPDIECILIINEKNKGIPANFNNGIKHAKGEWIKCLGSDDLLVKDAISNFVKRIMLDQHRKLRGAVFTHFETFGDSVISHKYPLAWTKWISAMRPSMFKRELANIHFNNLAPGAFINKNFLISFDTDYWLLEDLPLWLKLINTDVETDFYNFISVKYRIHSNQVTSIGTRLNKTLFNDLVKLNRKRLDNKYIIGYIHNNFNLYCLYKGNKYLKVMNPINIIIKLVEKVFS